LKVGRDLKRFLKYFLFENIFKKLKNIKKLKLKININLKFFKNQKTIIAININIRGKKITSIINNCY